MRFEKKVGKKGWIRITEAVVAILIMASVLIVLYVNDTPQVEISDYVYDLQVRLLTDVADRDDLRNATIYGDVDYLKTNFFNDNIPQNFNYNISICSLEDSCNYAPDVDTAIFVEDRIISSTLSSYQPKMLRLYVWENR